MKIGIMSDTHDRLEAVESAIKIFIKKKVELIIHCGDWVSPFVPQHIYKLEPRLSIPIKSVFGNCDGDIFRFFERQKKENWNIDFYKEIMELDFDGKKTVVYHGSSPVITSGLIHSGRFDLVLTGHTHLPVMKRYGKTTHINPGAVSGYYQATKKTIAVYDSVKNEAVIIDILT